MQFNTSRFNPIGLGVQEETINGHFVLPHSNHIGFLRSQLPANNPVIDLHQNDIISQRNHLIGGLGQLGLSQRVSEVRRAYLTPHRAQVHTTIDYFPVQNHAALSPSEVSVTKIIKTQFLTTISSRKNILVPNSTVHFQGQPSFQNQSVNDLFTKNMTFHGQFYENFTQNHQPINLVGSANHYEPKRYEILSPKLISAYVPEANLNHSSNQILDNGQLGINFQNISGNESGSNQIRVSNLINPLRASSSKGVPSSIRAASIVVQNDHVDNYDGRTHSLPTKKYGPYTCPKCGCVFYKSQSFAAHISSHYKHESTIERKKRQAAKYKKKYLHLFQSRDGLTIKPASFKMVGRRNTCGKEKMVTEIMEKEILKQEQVVPGMAAKRDFPYVGIKIKEEPL